MLRIPIHEPDDPRIAVFRQLKRTNVTRWAQTFVCEGEKLVARLLRSPYPADCLLAGEGCLQRFATPIPPEVLVYVLPDTLVERVVGFNFHRGLLASGRRLPPPELASLAHKPGRLTLVVCVDVHDPENLGTILRTSAALGIDGVVLAGRCADPLSRRVLRVSMGAVFGLPLAYAPDLPKAMDELRRQHGLQGWATVLDESAARLAEIERPERLALMLGNEGHGLDARWRHICDASVTIPMRRGVDSLNVAVAAGIFLFHLCADVRAKPAPVSLGESPAR